MPENQINLKTITELLGHNFYIPEYQRGYRWTRTNVTQLLNDIWEYRQETKNAKTFYCLQPVVVREASWLDIDGKTVNGYELIDGQQRLTTIHRIISYLMLEFLKTDSLISDYQKELYTIYYKTRLESAKFLKQNIYNNSKPDLYYLSEAYECIKEWFEDPAKGFGRAEKNRFLDVLLPELMTEENKIPEWSVQVIWYEIRDANQKSEELFTRLNRGKIPLTSAELIKAKFVNRDSFKELVEDDKIKRRTQLIQIWDEIESQLNNPKLWAFITNEAPEKYNNKIEYLFDIITQKRTNNSDSLYSFVHFFDTNETAESLWNKWIEVEEIFRSVSYWFSDKNLYHKIGYLIATGTNIKTLIDYKKSNSKKDFELKINTLIAGTIDDDWQDLSYDEKKHHEKITNVLLLTNIELTRSNTNNNEFFPFEIYKSISKSLEHINAQNIEGINENRKADWFQWIDAHCSILLGVATDKVKAQTIIGQVENINREHYKYEEFKALSEKILALIPRDEANENEYLHTIQNLALLGIVENIQLGNSVFEVKRKKVIEMDKKGAFIPVATKRIFLKYYADEGNQHYSIWTEKERSNYLDEITNSIATYKPIKARKHEEQLS